MTSPTKSAANRRNALRSTGPRTPAGKARSSKNARRHGLLAGAVVLPEVESAAEWGAHLDATFEDLAPSGRVEELLVERVAVLSWRLGRVVRYEREAAAMKQEDATEDVVTTEDYGERRQSYEEAMKDAEWKKPAFETLLRVMTHDVEGAPPAAADVDAGLLSEDEGEGAIELVTLVLRERGANLYTDKVVDELGPKNEEPWSVGLVSRAVDLLLQKAELQSATGRAAVKLEVLEAATSLAAVAMRRAGHLRRRLDRLRRCRLLPNEETLQKVMRYEAHLERSLFRSLHELQRLQAARAGGHVPAPVAVDVTMDERV